MEFPGKINWNQPLTSIRDFLKGPESTKTTSGSGSKIVILSNNFERRCISVIWTYSSNKSSIRDCS